MNTDIEKANFYLKAEEYDKAEVIFSKLLDEDFNSLDALKGLVICKIAQSSFEKSHLKVAGLYLERITTLGVPEDLSSDFANNINKSINEYLKKINNSLRKQSNEIVKRPALDGQLYAVKVFSDTTNFLGFVNENADKYREAIEISEKTYDFSSEKEKIARDIVKMIDMVLSSLRYTPDMDGKLLANASGLSFLNRWRTRWASLSGSSDKIPSKSPAQTGGCLVLFTTLAGAMGFLAILFITLL